MPADDGECSIVSHISSRTSEWSRFRLKGAKPNRLIAEHKMQKLREQHEIERARRELDVKQQLLEQQSELEEAIIEETVWQKAVDEEVGVPVPTDRDNPPPIGIPSDVDRNNAADSDIISGRFRDNATAGRITNATIQGAGDGCVHQSPATPSPDARILPSTHRKMSTNVPSSACDVTTTSIDVAFQRLAATLQEGFNLPKPELLTLSGSSTDYFKFVKNFETNIENRVHDDRLRLSYLIQYCTGEAKQAIEDCVLLEPSDGYKRARLILYSRYGRLAKSYVDSLVYGPQIQASDTNALLHLSLEMQKCEITPYQLGFESDVNNSENLRRIVKRLPMHMRRKWADVAHSINESGREPDFSDLTSFVDEKARVANSVYGFDLVKGNNQSKTESKVNQSKEDSEGVRRISTLMTHSECGISKHVTKCSCCSGTCKELTSCSRFKSLTLADRYKLVHKLKLCYNCLKSNHSSKVCRLPQVCAVSDCKSKHHTLLHSWVSSESNHTAAQPSVNCASTRNTVIKNCLGTVPVIVRGENGNTCKTYALLDDGADKTLCDERLLKTMNVSSRPVTFKMSTVNSDGNAICGQEVDLQVQPINGNGKVTLQKVWSVKSLPISKKSAVADIELRRLPYLADIEIPQINASDVMLLIGTDAPEAHIPLEVISDSDQPYAVRSRLGWAVRGPIPATETSDTTNVHFEKARPCRDIRKMMSCWLWKTKSQGDSGP